MTQIEIKQRLKEVIGNLERMHDLLQEPISPEQAVVISSLHNSEASQQYALTGVLDER